MLGGIAHLFMIHPSIIRGRLSLGSFTKLCVIAALGVLPVIAILFVVAFLLGVARSPTPGHAFQSSLSQLVMLWPIVLFQIVGGVVSTVLTGLFAGVCGFPFYSWLCRRRGGIYLRGSFPDII